MKIVIQILFSFLVCISFLSCSAKKINPLNGEEVTERKNAESRALFELWGRIQSPKEGEPNSIGFYSAGCLAGAQALALEGEGYVVMKTGRRRFYGHPDLLNFIESLGMKFKKNRWGVLLVGDMGLPRGGPMISGHASHQIGLDADLWFTFPTKKPSKVARERMSSLSMIDRVKNKVNRKLWFKKHAQILAATAKNPSVDRIFVNPIIKSELCKNAENYKDWLWKIRPWWGHDSHFHVRLKCPANSSNCQAQEILDPQNLACSKDELNWWTSKESIEELQKRQEVLAMETRVFPKLPEQCNDLTK